MGRITDRFGSNTYDNEAEVSQNFVVPLLKEFLAYRDCEIKPERYYPVGHLYSGVNELWSAKRLGQKPDFVICIDGDVTAPKFIIDSKGPGEDIEKHLGQLRSYAVGVGTNIIMITNGSTMKIYDVNEDLFHAENIEDLDIKLDILKRILSREVQSTMGVPEILKQIDIDQALGNKIEDLAGERRRILRVKLSDFSQYNEKNTEIYSNWHKSEGIFSFLTDDINRVFPNRILKFSSQTYIDSHNYNSNEYYLWDLLEKFSSNKILLIGPSGCGKSSLLRFLANRQASKCLALESAYIPVYIELKYYSHNKPLEGLILDSFTECNLVINSGELRSYISKQNFFFLFDAIDEVSNELMHDCAKEIKRIAENSNHKVIVTTRETHKYLFPSFCAFSIQTLSEESIHYFVSQAILSNSDRMMQEIGKKGLLREAKNILILVLMILIFKKSGSIPVSRFRIVYAFMEYIKEWELGKLRRTPGDLNWSEICTFLRALAYHCMESNSGLAIPKSDSDKVILDLITYLEDDRVIHHGMKMSDIYRSLEYTGFVICSSDNVMFYHRAILEHFASEELSKRFAQDRKILTTKLFKIPWERIVIAANLFLKNSNPMIELLIKHELELAALSLPEVNEIHPDLVNRVVDLLSSMCFSKLINVRRRALGLLERLDIEYTSGAFFKLALECKYIDVKMNAIENFSRTRSEDAKELVYRNIELDYHSLLDFSSGQGTIAKALANFDVKEHLIILNILRNNKGIVTKHMCGQALMSVVENSQDSPEFRDAILELYCSHDNDSYENRRTLSDVISEFRDKTIIPRLLDDLSDGDFLHNTYTADILASFTSMSVIEVLFRLSTNTVFTPEFRRICTSALKKSRGEVPLYYFQELLNDNDSLIGMYAIEGLERYETADILESLMNNLDIPDEDLDRWRVQDAVIKVLSNRGLLTKIIEDRHFPNRITVDSFVSEVAKYRLSEFIPVLRRIAQKETNTRWRAKVAHALLLLGEEQASYTIVDDIFNLDHKSMNDNYYFIDLLALASDSNMESCLSIVDKIVRINRSIVYNSYIETKCIEALEVHKGAESKSYLKRMLSSIIDEPDHNVLDIERILRALNSMVTVSDTDWYLDFIESNPGLSKFDLNRALEGISFIGTDECIEVLYGFARDNRDNQYLHNNCIWFIENAFVQRGTRKYVTEEELDN